MVAILGFQKRLIPLILFPFLFIACKKTDPNTGTPSPNPPSSAYRITRNITYNNLRVTVVIDKPANNEVDVLVVYHGTVGYDSLIVTAANNTLDGFKNILTRNDMMVVSVAYPEENLLFGDNIAFAEAGLLWVKERAAQELGITVKKVFIAGHSQGGYLVTRLNRLHATNGAIANGPGPLNLVYRCGLEENGTLAGGSVCALLRNQYGTTTDNPDAYFQRSLLNFTEDFKSDILFVQGLDDSPIQMYSWPTFTSQVNACSNCLQRTFYEVPGAGHTALFNVAGAKAEFNRFIASH